MSKAFCNDCGTRWAQDGGLCRKCGNTKSPARRSFKRSFNGGVGLSQKHPRGSLGVSWWANHAKPGQRESFMIAAHERDDERREKFVAGYANAAGRTDE